MKKLSRFLICLSTSLFAPTFAVLASPNDDKTVVVGVETILYLPHYGVENDNYVGFARELLDLFLTDQGMTPKYQPLPIRRLMSALVDQEIDLKYPDNPLFSADLKKDKNVVYSVPVVAFRDGVSVMPEKLQQPVKQLGLVQGFTAFGFLEKIESGEVKLQAASNFTSLIEMALSDRVDGVYGNSEVIRYTLKEVMKKPGALVLNDALPGTSSHYHLSSVRKPELVKAFDSWFAANNGKISAMKARYDLN